MERRKNQPSAGPDIELANDDLTAETRKKESKLYHFSAVACFLVLVCLVFFSSSASGPLRQQYGLGKEETIVSRYEVDVDTTQKDFQPVKADEVVQKPVTLLVPNKITVEAEIAQMVEQNTRCQVKVNSNASFHLF